METSETQSTLDRVVKGCGELVAHARYLETLALLLAQENKALNELMAKVAQKHPTHSRFCKNCEAPFVTARIDQFYCCKRCQNTHNQRKWRQNKAATEGTCPTKE